MTSKMVSTKSFTLFPSSFFVILFIYLKADDEDNRESRMNKKLYFKEEYKINNNNNTEVSENYQTYRLYTSFAYISQEFQAILQITAILIKTNFRGSGFPCGSPARLIWFKWENRWTIHQRSSYARSRILPHFLAFYTLFVTTNSHHFDPTRVLPSNGSTTRNSQSHEQVRSLDLEFKRCR